MNELHTGRVDANILLLSPCKKSTVSDIVSPAECLKMNTLITIACTDSGVHAGNAFTHSANPSWQRIPQVKTQILGKHQRRNTFLSNQTALGRCKSILWPLEWTTHAGNRNIQRSRIPGQKQDSAAPFLSSSYSLHLQQGRSRARSSHLTLLSLKELPPLAGKILPSVTLMQRQWNQCDSLSRLAVQAAVILCHLNCR